MVDKITLDFRYWDTDIEKDVGGLCFSTGAFQCDERFVFSVGITLP